LPQHSSSLSLSLSLLRALGCHEFAATQLLSLSLAVESNRGLGCSARDGKFSLDKVLAFFELAAEHARFYRAHEFQAQVRQRRNSCGS
jgi:hypothetical protein